MQRHKGFAGATGHNALAPVMAAITLNGGLNRLSLMRTRRFLGLESNILNAGKAELTPINRAIGQILHPQPLNRNGLIR